MATLSSPWTVIGDHHGRPPLATWHDQSNGLFIGLLDDSESSAAAAVAKFQTYSRPSNSSGAGVGTSKAAVPSSEKELIQREDPFVVQLPAALLLQKDESDAKTNNSAAPGEEEDEDESPIKLAKLSLDQRYVAIQFTDTMVRIAKVGDNDSVRDAERSVVDNSMHSASDASAAAAAAPSKHQKHFTIDLSANGGQQPMQSDPDTMPRPDLFAGGAGAVARAAGFHARKFLSNRRGSSGDDGNMTSADDTILPGGMIWIDRETDGHPILVLVTSQTVRLYKISPAKHSMRLLESYSVPSKIDCFWYEPQARCLVVGTLRRFFEDGRNIESFDMRAFSFQQQRSNEEDGGGDQGRRSDNMTMVFDPFAVGKQSDGQLSFDSIALVFIYGKVFCVAIGEKSATFTKLDSSKGRVVHMKDIPYPNSDISLSSDMTKVFAAVVDNTVLIVDRGSDECILLDVWDMASEPFRALISSDEFGDEETTSFLPPCSLLNSSGRGYLYDISLDLKSVVKSLPPTAAVVSFLLRRRLDPSLSHSLALVIIKHVFNGESKDSSVLLLTFLGLLGNHKDNDLVSSWDNSASLPLIPRAALLSSDEHADTTTAAMDEEFDMPDTIYTFLTQTEMLRHVLIPRSLKAITQDDVAQLNLICEFCLLYMQTLEQCNIPRTPALECLVVALLWRLGNGAEIASILRARHQWRKAVVPNSPEFKADAVGQEALAEMLIAIVTNPNFKYEGSDGDRISKLVIAYAIDLLNNVRSFQVAGKQLLALGRCGDAITITQKAIGPKRSQPVVPIKDAQAYDFFTAAIHEAKALESVGDRCRLLFNVHSFISDYDPDCMVMQPSDNDGELQSALAAKFGRFPSELFGNDDDSSAISLKAMFGFSIAHTHSE